RQRHPQRKGPHLIAYHGLIACIGLDFLRRFTSWHTCRQTRHVPQKVPHALAWHVHGDLCVESHSVSPSSLASHPDVCGQHIGASYQILCKAPRFIHKAQNRSERRRRVENARSKNCSLWTAFSRGAPPSDRRR